MDLEAFVGHVRVLTKPGSSIRSELLMNEGEALHACLGLSSELSELVDNNGSENVLEEVGDSLFFLHMLANAYRLTVVPNVYSSTPGYDEQLLKLTLFVGVVVNQVKSTVIYRKPMNKVTLEANINRLAGMYINFAGNFGFTLEEVLVHNHAKLSKRYPNGYNDTDGVLRKDKA